MKGKRVLHNDTCNHISFTRHSFLKNKKAKGVPRQKIIFPRYQSQEKSETVGQERASILLQNSRYENTAQGLLSYHTRGLFFDMPNQGQGSTPSVSSSKPAGGFKKGDIECCKCKGLLNKASALYAVVCRCGHLRCSKCKVH